MSFTQHSQEVARRFIRTALVVDDRAFRNGDREDKDQPRGGLTPPPGTRRSEGATDPEPDPPATPEDHPSTRSQPEADDDQAHALNAERVIKDFAAGSVFCTVAGVENDDTLETLAARVLPLASQADVFVSDWVLFTGGEREGGGAAELILQTIEADNSPERFRLILIYTGTAELADIADSIKDKLEENSHTAEKDGDYTVKCGAVRIAVYAKPEAPIDDAVPALVERRVRTDELVAKVVEEYASATAGLVSNAALSALAAVRNNSHRLLRSFHPSLDAPYLAHRMMLPAPEDAEAHLVQLIMDEIRSAVDDAGVGEEASFTRIKEWITHHAHTLDFSLLFKDGDIPDGTDGSATAALLLEIGSSKATEEEALNALGNSKYLRRVASSPHKLPLTQAFVTSQTSRDVEAQNLDHEFAALTSLRTRYGKNAPLLTAGVIVRFHNELREQQEGDASPHKYGLCIQPLCDSVRLSASTQFPFLQLELIEQKDPENQPKFSLVVPDDMGYLYLKVDYSPRNLVLKTFEPTRDWDRVLFLQREGEEGWQVPSVDGETCEYLAELKLEQAIRALAHFAQQAGRPGLDESEWLRRWTT